MRFAMVLSALLVTAGLTISGCCGSGDGDPSAAEVVIRYVQDQEWIDHYFQEGGVGDIFAFDVTLPVKGKLKLRLMDRDDCLFQSEDLREAGTSRNSVQYQKLMGKDILNGDLGDLFKPEEVASFKESYPDFEDRCVLKVHTRWQERVRVVPTENGSKMEFGPETSKFESIYYPKHKELGSVIGVGVHMPNGECRIKAGEPIILHSWIWATKSGAEMIPLKLDDDERLMTQDERGDWISVEDWKSPLWALIMKFEPEEDDCGG